MQHQKTNNHMHLGIIPSCGLLSDHNNLTIKGCVMEL